MGVPPKSKTRLVVAESLQGSKEEAIERLIEFYRSNPNASYTAAGEVIERSKGTVANYLSELEQTGIVHRNGNGVEVLND